MRVGPYPESAAEVAMLCAAGATHYVNLIRAGNNGRAACRNGHLFTETTTYYRGKARACRICRREARRRFDARRRLG